MKTLIMTNYLCLGFMLILFSGCGRGAGASNTSAGAGLEKEPIMTGAQQTELYFPLLEGKRIAVAGNHTSMIGSTHLVDTLLASGFDVKKVFSPEHGFRGQAAAGELISNEVDQRTGLPIISLYGSNRRPTPEQLNGLDVIVFDMQDVGVRFYTYISTMSLIMREAALLNIPVIILDRPNPNGHFVDGPLLDMQFSSFVGMHPVPVVHGMTVGEYALMVNGEEWLGPRIIAPLTVIPVKNYTHSCFYELPLPPSPNLPNMQAVYLYPSLCFFEGTPLSVGRGTSKPFQIFGHSSLGSDKFDYSFVPQSVRAAPDPPEKNKTCFGRDLSQIPLNQLQAGARLDLGYLLEAFREFPKKDQFFNNFFDRLAGNNLLRNQILAGLSEDVIRQSWQADLEAFKAIRVRYLLYPDFE